jgi:DNA-binding transcriptional LysR family regulator
VVDELHFGRAAERLHVAQPAVSQAVRRLEEELGLQLLHRTSRVVTLTEPGRVFAEEARRALASVDRAIEATLRAGGDGSALRVGCVPQISMERLQRFLATLQQRDPSLRASVTHSFPADQVASLRNMELDVGIFRYEGYEGIGTEPLFAGEPLMAYLAAGHPLAEKPVLGPDDLANENLIGLPLEAATDECTSLRTQLHDLGYRFASVQEPRGLDPRDLMMDVAEGRGVLLATSSMAETTRATAVVARRPMEPTIPLPDVVVAWRTDPPDHLRTIVALVRQVARELRHAGLD